MRTVRRPLALLASVVAVTAGTAAMTTPAFAAKKKAKPVTVLVTNDDGYAAPGIDAVVEALRTVKGTKIVVSAPATNQSGTGGKVTGGTLTATQATTKSGYPATSVQGFPADSVVHAIQTAGVKPAVTVSGCNAGQNLGPITDISGTVGAARQSAKLGVPAVATSQQLGEVPDFPTCARLAKEWLVDWLKATKNGTKVATPSTIDSINVPNCASGSIRGLYKTTVAPAGTEGALNSGTVACATTGTTYANDVLAFNDGWATITTVGLNPAS
jgi:5'-nucleotidase